MGERWSGVSGRYDVHERDVGGTRQGDRDVAARFGESMAVLYERARNWWIGSDPGLLRLRTATRTTAALGCSLLILFVVTRATGQPLTVALLGVVITMVASRSVNEPDPRRQRITMALLPVPAALSITVAALLAPHPVASDAVFVVVVFAAVYIRRFGARGGALGMVAFMSYLFTLYLRAGISELPWLIGAVAVGTVCTFVMSAYVLPDRPERVLRGTSRALRARMAIVVDTTAEAVRTGRLDERRRRRMRARTIRLNETALMVQSQIEDKADPAVLWPGVQVSVAASLAIVTGELVSPSRWYWAVIAAFVIFAGTNSWGETLTKGWQRLLGTMLGVPCGVLVATLFAGDKTASLVAIFVCLFCSFYCMTVTYSLMTFWITTMLALLYGLLGQFSFGVLMLRLEETAIGAVIGVAVAILVLPTNTRTTIRKDTRAYLTALSSLIEISTATMFGGDETGSPTEQARQLDRALQQFRVSAKPLLAGFAGLGGRRSIRRGLRIFTACDRYGRSLARNSEQYQDPVRQLHDRRPRLRRVPGAASGRRGPTWAGCPAIPHRGARASPDRTSARHRGDQPRRGRPIEGTQPGCSLNAAGTPATGRASRRGRCTARWAASAPS